MWIKLSFLTQYLFDIADSKKTGNNYYEVI